MWGTGAAAGHRGIQGTALRVRRRNTPCRKAHCYSREWSAMMRIIMSDSSTWISGGTGLESMRACMLDSAFSIRIHACGISILSYTFPASVLIQVCCLLA
jgi:hypothetical protein